MNKITLTLTVSDPEVAKQLIDLAANMVVPLAPSQTVAAPVTYLQPVTPTVPVQSVVAPSVPVPPQVSVPVAPAIPTVPVAPPPVPVAPTPAAVPVAQPQAYTLEQLSVAATPLIDAGRREELLALVHSFGVQALTQLPKEQYGTFATALRGLGAKI